VPVEINQNSFCRTLGSWVVAMPGCRQRCSDTATSEAFVLLATSASRGDMDLEPVNAITISPVAKIAPHDGICFEPSIECAPVLPGQPPIVKSYTAFSHDTPLRLVGH
jgi:hypothetical protein